MTVSENGVAVKPEVIEGPGRYVVYQGPESWKLARATDICETCRNCGCGEQADVIDLPDFSQGRAGMLAWLMKNADTGVLGKLKGLMGRG